MAMTLTSLREDTQHYDVTEADCSRNVHFMNDLGNTIWHWCNSAVLPQAAASQYPQVCLL